MVFRSKVGASALGAGMCALALAFAACGGSSGGDSDGSAGTGGGGTAGSGDGGGAAGSGGGQAGSGDEGGAAGSGSGGGSAGADTGTSEGYTELDNSAYAGVDLSALPMGQAPTGCVGGFDAAKGALVLALEPPVNFALVGSFEGSVVVNGVPCTAPDGAQARVSATSSVAVRGGDGDDVVVLDLGTGAFGAPLFSPGAGVRVELGGGSNGFYLRGSAEADAVRLGRDGAAAVFDLNGDGSRDVHVEGAGAIGVSLGPGDDSLDARGFGTFAPFAQALTAHGDDGNDAMGGGDGSDALFGDAGDDTFVTAAAPDGADAYDGGEGVDVLDYGARTAALRVTTDGAADDGEAGEGDNVRGSVEGVLGGPGNDTFIGGSEDNYFDGRGGADRLEGHGGNDSLYGGDGDDTLNGGEGDDTLDGGGGADALDGGPDEGDICASLWPDTVTGCEL